LLVMLECINDARSHERKTCNLLRLQNYHVKNGVTTSYYIQGSVSYRFP